MVANTTQPSVTLNDARAMPRLGYGVWQAPPAEAEAGVKQALELGYRSIDTAQDYGNEEAVGRGLARSGIPRDDIFLTTKVFNNDQGFDQTLRAMEASLTRLGVDYVDLYLIHWPSAFRGLYLDTWRALIRLQEEGRARSIGVSNFQPPHLLKLFEETSVVPAVNQIELHPIFQQRELRNFHAQHGIATESWSPLGQGTLLDHPVLNAIAEKYGRTPAQVILRWHLDNDLIAIPKSVTPARIAENFAVFDFALDQDDRTLIDGLDSAAGRIGPDPDTANW